MNDLNQDVKKAETVVETLVKKTEAQAVNEYQTLDQRFRTFVLHNTYSVIVSALLIGAVVGHFVL